MKKANKKIDYLKPLSIATVFKFTTNAENIPFILSSVKNSLFESVTMQTDYRGVRIEYKISTTIQSMKLTSLNSEYFQRTEKRFRNEFFKRMQNIGMIMIDFSQKTNVSFCSCAYKPKF